LLSRGLGAWSPVHSAREIGPKRGETYPHQHEPRVKHRTASPLAHPGVSTGEILTDLGMIQSIQVWLLVHLKHT
jgi:hypothetical protein